MKKNLKFLITAIVSIVSLSAVTCSAMQNNPDGGDNKHKNYGFNTIFENQDQEQNANSNNSESNTSELIKDEEEETNKKKFEAMEEIERKIRNKVDLFQMSPEQIRKYLGLGENVNVNNSNIEKNEKNEKNK